MFSAEFYPTPKSIATEMWRKLREADVSYVLEPSAGKGDIADIDKDRLYGRKAQIDTIEIDPELKMILAGKGYSVVHGDFLTFSPSKKYDGIIMNPPFSKGVDHILKAWDILTNGRIVCLLNAETVNNKCNRKRVLLGSIIEQHGLVEQLGTCFIDAERKTAVDVAMVVLDKVDNGKEFGFFDEVATERKAESFSVDGCEGLDLAKFDMVGSMVEQYKSALDAYRDFLRAKNKVRFYTKNLAENIDLLKAHEPDQGQYNRFVDDLSGSCWDAIFEKTGIKKFITEGVRKDFEKFRDGNRTVDFTVENIKSMVLTLGASAPAIMQEALLRVFDDLTRYDKKNTVHVEGWKTNDAWKVNKKVIIPFVIDTMWSDESPRLSYHYQRIDKVKDIDRVMCTLSGKDYNDITTVEDGLCEAFKDGWGTLAESEFFTIRFYKKGTIHLTFKDSELLGRFNRAAAKGKNWLPEKGE